jgi:hypothetical protein
MKALRDQFNVHTKFIPCPKFVISMNLYWIQSKIVDGETSLTCDAWQASNVNCYFAVMGHWIEEVAPKQWKLKHTLLKFTQLNTAHDGVCIRKALYKICDCLNIVHKVKFNLLCSHLTHLIIS